VKAYFGFLEIQNVIICKILELKCHMITKVSHQSDDSNYNVGKNYLFIVHNTKPYIVTKTRILLCFVNVGTTIVLIYKRRIITLFQSV
jgi:hypothetical protein